MPLAAKILALMEQLTEEQLAELAGVELYRFRQLCRHWLDRTEPRRDAPPKEGVLSELRDGRGHR
jgi:hypothetical protein